MYRPPAFKVDDLPTLHRFMNRYSFATLITATPAGTQATHLPLVLDPKDGEFGTLRGHFARANPHGQAIGSPAESAALFQGPHAYVSPRDYTGQHPAVPTWNYTAVHAHGPLQPLDQPEQLTAHLAALVKTHESGSLQPWGYDPASTLNAGLLKGIVGFEMPIRRVEGKFKLSQNRSPEDRTSLHAALQAGSPPQQSLAEFIGEWTTPPHPDQP